MSKKRYTLDEISEELHEYFKDKIVYTASIPPMDPAVAKFLRDLAEFHEKSRHSRVLIGDGLESIAV